jgi:glycosyltransferase involved in cell wall biosynthesis
MGMTRLLPKRIPTTFGTPELVDLAHRSGRRGVELLLPPIDTESDVAARVDSKSFRHRCGIQPGDFTLVTVSRLDHWLKGDSLFRTMDVVSHLAKEMPVRFVLVGDGTARDALAAKSAAINEKAGREVVVLPGNMIDPRPAYAMADVVIGMGGSALRGMSFGKPVLIVGKGNFCAPLTPETAHSFYYQGIYGHGTESANNDPILNEVRALASDPQRAHRLGCFAREFVCEHFSLEKVSAALASFCTRAAAERESLHSAAIDGLRTGATYLRERRFLQSF